MVCWYKTILGLLIMALAWLEASKWILVVVGLITFIYGLMGKCFCSCKGPTKKMTTKKK